jgi:SAM-dependent methyltransferase
VTAWRLAASLAGQIEWRALRLAWARCPLCEARLFVRFSHDLLGTRCLGCRASAISMAVGTLLRSEVPDLANKRILELSSRGPLHAFLARTIAIANGNGNGNGSLVGCEYFDDVAPGEFRGSVQCQDVEQLTFADNTFDLCTHTEVFEHVPDDRRGFREIFRVLAPGGAVFFTVPLSQSESTTERARRESGGRIHHLEKPAYHDDLIRGARKVLVYRDYGRDITTRLQQAGFVTPRIQPTPDPANLGTTAQVVIAKKPTTQQNPT